MCVCLIVQVSGCKSEGYTIPDIGDDTCDLWLSFRHILCIHIDGESCGCLGSNLYILDMGMASTVITRAH